MDSLTMQPQVTPVDQPNAADPNSRFTMPWNCQNPELDAGQDDEQTDVPDDEWSTMNQCPKLSNHNQQSGTNQMKSSLSIASPLAQVDNQDRTQSILEIYMQMQPTYHVLTEYG